MHHPIRKPFRATTSSRRAAIATSLALLTLAAAPAFAAAPTLSTAAGSTPTCGAPQDLCTPGQDVATNAAPTVAMTVYGGFAPHVLGLQPGDDVISFSWGADDLINWTSAIFSVDGFSAGTAGLAVGIEAAVGDAAGDGIGDACECP
jgi:hypothetical protein